MIEQFQPYLTIFFGSTLTGITSVFLYKQTRADKAHDKLVEGLTAANLVLREVYVKQTSIEKDVTRLTSQVDKHVNNQKIHQAI